MKRISLLALPLLLFIGCSTLSTKDETGVLESHGPAPRITALPFVGGYKVHEMIYENGLQVLFVEDHSSPTFAYHTWFKVGSRDEEAGRTGLAHLFEHMMFKETKNLPEGEFDRLLESAGAEGENAFTSRDYTAYVQELPKDKFDLILRLESERMTHLIINQAAFATEREVVQNERRFRNENSPDGLMYQELFALAFKRHSYHWPVIGYQKDLARMTAEDGKQFYETYYSPNHATIVIVGDLQLTEVERGIRHYYGNLSKKASPQRKIPAEPVQISIRRKEIPLNIKVEKLLLGYHIPSVNHQDVSALKLLQGILTGGRSSRLSTALIDTGIATDVETYPNEDKDPSLFIVGVNLQQNKRAIQAETVILRELTRLMNEPVTDEELTRAKNMIRFKFLDSIDTNFEKAYFLGHYEVTAGSFRRGIELQDQMQKLTAAEFKEVVQKYFQQSQRTIVRGVPKWRT